MAATSFKISVKNNHLINQKTNTQSEQEMTPNEQRECSEFVIKLGVGQIALVKMWLKKYKLPFKDEDISYTITESGCLKSFTIELNCQAMQE